MGDDGTVVSDGTVVVAVEFGIVGAEVSSTKNGVEVVGSVVVGSSGNKDVGVAVAVLLLTGAVVCGGIVLGGIVSGALLRGLLVVGCRVGTFVCITIGISVGGRIVIGAVVGGTIIGAPVVGLSVVKNGGIGLSVGSLVAGGLVGCSIGLFVGIGTK